MNKRLNKQRARLKEHLKECKEQSLHFDTSERLTSKQRKAMPWLMNDDDFDDDDLNANLNSKITTVKTDDEKEKDINNNSDDDIKNENDYESNDSHDTEFTQL